MVAKRFEQEGPTMQYLGGKSRLAKGLTQAILQATTLREHLIEPFMGGGGMTAVIAEHFQTVDAYDNHPDLVLMWQALLNGWEPPEHISEEEYKEIRKAEPSALRAFVGFGCSFGGMWLRSYARNARGDNYAARTRRVLLRDIAKMQNVTVRQSDYRAVSTPGIGDVVYADPPYAGTAWYHCPFDNVEFWNVMDEWVDCGATVFVSEFTAPPHWVSIYQQPRRMTLDNVAGRSGQDVTDNLFISTRL